MRSGDRYEIAVKRIGASVACWTMQYMYSTARASLLDRCFAMIIRRNIDRSFLPDIAAMTVDVWLDKLNVAVYNYKEIVASMFHRKVQRHLHICFSPPVPMFLEVVRRKYIIRVPSRLKAKWPIEQGS